MSLCSPFSCMDFDSNNVRGAVRSMAEFFLYFGCLLVFLVEVLGRAFLMLLVIAWGFWAQGGWETSVGVLFLGPPSAWSHVACTLANESVSFQGMRKLAFVFYSS